MRILMVEKTRVGGVHIHVSSVAKELRKRGYEVDIVTRVEDLGLPSFISSYSAMKKFFTKMARQYDIIHAHDWSIAYPAVRAGVRNLVATFHGLPTNAVARYFQNTAVSSLGDHAIVVSPRMLLIYPCARYIPNGVNIRLFKCARKRYKNGKSSAITLGVAQRYSREAILKIARKFGFRVVVAEEIPYDQMPDFYASLDVFVSIPPHTTGFNMVWLEAMACEVPYVIGTNVGIGEILPIYKVNNFRELETLLSAIKEETLPPLKGSRRWISENGFTWETHAQKLVYLYNEVL